MKNYKILLASLAFTFATASFADTSEKVKRYLPSKPEQNASPVIDKPVTKGYLSCSEGNIGTPGGMPPPDYQNNCICVNDIPVCRPK